MITTNKKIPITIDAIYNSTSIFFSLDVEVEDTGILFNKFNGIYLSGNAVFEDPETPQNVKIINKGSELKGKKLKIFSRYNVIAPTDDDAKFPRVIWKPNLEAGDHTLYDIQESVISDDNMFEFSITFTFN